MDDSKAIDAIALILWGDDAEWSADTIERVAEVISFVRTYKEA